LEVYAAGRIAGPGSAAPTRDTLYEIGSVTKLFTGLLLARAVVQERGGLREPLSAWLGPTSGLSEAAGRLTPLQLATHTAGLPRDPPDLRSGGYDPTNPFAHVTDAALLEAVGSPQPPAPLRPKYSNLGFGLLGWALAQAFKQPYPRALDQEVLRPLGMVATTTERPERGVARGYVYGLEVAPWSFGATAGAGALRSSARDLLRFLSAQLRPRASALPGAISLSQQAHFQDAERSIGLAWGRYRLEDGATLFRHNGGTGGFRAFIGFIPQRDRGVVVLSNSAQAGLDELGLHQLDPDRHPLPKSSRRAVATVLAPFMDGSDPAPLRPRLEGADTHPRHLNLLGYTYLKAGRVAEALRCFRWNVELHPEWADGFDSLGDGYVAAEAWR
ncbi:MAG: serine hydrolase, partial [Myxococcota bacterium]